MTVKEYLGQIRELNSRINRELSKLESIRARLYSSGIDYSKPSVQTSPQDTMAKVYAEINEQERCVVELIDRLVDLKRTIMEQIGGLPEQPYRWVLTEHYVNCMSMSELSVKSGTNRTTLYRMRDAALDEFGRLYDVDYSLLPS